MTVSRTVGIATVVALACVGAVLPASAQTWPGQQPVRIVVPFSPGSATDLLARTLSDKLAERWKTNVIVENRPGLPGTTTVAKSAADGYTLMLTSNGHTIAGVINKNLSFDPLKDFAGIAPVANVPLALIVPTDSPAHNVKELIAHAKANPGKLNFSSPGLGSSTFIAAAMFKQAAGIDIVHVPYKGAPESVTAVVRGDVQMYFAPVNVVAELVEAKQVRAIAVATAQRIPTLKDVPTIAESGIEGFKYDSWFGMLAPAGVPRDIITRVNKDTVEILRDKDVVERLAAQGVVPMIMSAEEFDRLIVGDTTRLAEMFKDGAK